MSNLEWLAKMSKEGARDTMENMECPFGGNCVDCKYDFSLACKAANRAVRLFQEWLIAEAEPEDEEDGE